MRGRCVRGQCGVKVEEAKKHAHHACKLYERDSPVPIMNGLFRTHVPPQISASFKSFFAYSTGPESVVLMGYIDTDAPVPPPSVHDPPLRPTIIPVLQYRSVISVVVGDFHYGALTSTGELLTWGSFSKGALGLGDPLALEPGEPGAFETAEHKRTMQTAQWMRLTPPEVRVPTAVSFDYTKKGRRTGRKRFAFGVAAAGWHMGALVIDLEVRDRSKQAHLSVLLTHFCL